VSAGFHDGGHDKARRLDAVRSGALDAAEHLFYSRGVRAVGMDEIRAESGLSLKRLYQLFPSKDDLVVGFLRRRDEVWRARLTAYVDANGGTPEERLLAVFDWLGEWVREPDFRGCAWINCFGELGAQSPGVVLQVRTHKSAFRRYLVRLTKEAGLDTGVADQLMLLFEGATTTAAIVGTARPVRHARAAARALVAKA
jgi:AcrR family transcriptional regulator